MLRIGAPVYHFLRANLAWGIAAVVLSGCGLGMSNADRVERGEAAFADADFAAAIIDARNVLRDEPDNVAARLLLGRSSVEVGDGASAEKELRRALQLGADRSGIVSDLGRALLMQGKFDDVVAEIAVEDAAAGENRQLVRRIRGDAFIGLGQPEAAREYYRAVLREDSGDTIAQVGIVNSLISEMNFAQARETLNQILGNHGEFVPAWLVSGSLSMRMGDAERSANDYRRAAELARAATNQANELQALTGLANAALALRDVAEAKAAADRMLALAENDTRTVLTEARVAAAEGDWGKAQEKLQEVLRRAPEYRPAQLLLGVAHKESGNLSQAEMYISAVVAAVPDHQDARRLLAEVRLLLGEADEARETLAPLIDSGDADFGSMSMAARASMNIGNFDDATGLLMRMAEAEPDNIELKLQLAFAYFRSGRTDEAAEVLGNLPAATTDRNELQRDSLLVLTQAARGNLEEALDGARALVSRWPDQLEPRILTGSVEVASGDVAAARETFESAAALAPDNPLPVRYLAGLDVSEEDYAAAKGRYEQILQQLPEDVPAMLALAKLAARKEAFEETRSWLQRARDSDPEAREPRRTLAAMHLAFREFDEAQQVAEEALALDPDDAELQNVLGQAQFSLEHYRDAEESFSRAIQLDASNADYRLNLAKVHAGRGNTSTAMATLNEPPGQYLEHLPSAIMFATLKVSANLGEEAMQIARQLKDLYPESAMPLALAGELYAAEGNFVGASAAYDEAIAKQPEGRYAVRAFQIRSSAGIPGAERPLVDYLEERPLDNNVRAFLAQSYQGMQQYDKSIAEYEQLLEAAPESFVILNNLAWSYLETNDPRAEDVARRANALQPGNSSVLDTLGWILVRNGRAEEGVSLLRQAVELGGDRAEIRYHLAAGLAALGQKDDAKQILDELLAADDAFGSREDAQELLSTL